MIGRLGALAVSMRATHPLATEVCEQAIEIIRELASPPVREARDAVLEEAAQGCVIRSRAAFERACAAPAGIYAMCQEGISKAHQEDADAIRALKSEAAPPAAETE